MIEKIFDSAGETKRFRYAVTQGKCEITNVRFSAVTDDGGDWLSFRTENGYLYLTVDENTIPQERSGSTYAYFSGKEPCVDGSHTIRVVQEGKDCGTLVSVTYEIPYSNTAYYPVGGCGQTQTITLPYLLNLTYSNDCQVVESGTTTFELDLERVGIYERNCGNEEIRYENKSLPSTAITGIPSQVQGVSVTPKQNSFTINILQEVCQDCE